jgi:hypothetical protein
MAANRFRRSCGLAVGMQLAGIRLPGRNLGPHHVAFALGVGPGLEVVHGAEQVIALAPARLAGPLLQLG